MLPMNLIDASQTTYSPAVALSIHTNHNYLFSAVPAPFLAKGFIFLKTHCKRFIITANYPQYYQTLTNSYILIQQ
jgi:hypothetical protein